MNKTTYAQLNIKQKSLAKESRIIKSDVKKYARENEIYTSANLYEHLRTVVKPECRATGLSLAFMKGKEYNTVEHKRKPEKEYEFQYYTLKALHRILKKYHDKDITMQEVRDWTTI